MGQLDASIVQLAMPSLETAFDASLNAVSWVAVGYMLAVACALPIFSRLAEIAGRKSIFLSGFASFAVLSTLCGLAPTLGSIIVPRVLLGIGGAMAGANNVVILVTAAGPERRGRALGIMAATQAIGFAIGPTAGGVMLGTLGWRWYSGSMCLFPSWRSFCRGSLCRKRPSFLGTAASTGLAPCFSCPDSQRC
jgi:MFS family permease